MNVTLGTYSHIIIKVFTDGFKELDVLHEC